MLVALVLFSFTRIPPSITILPNASVASATLLCAPRAISKTSLITTGSTGVFNASAILPPISGIPDIGLGAMLVVMERGESDEDGVVAAVEPEINEKAPAEWGLTLDESGEREKQEYRRLGRSWL